MSRRYRVQVRQSMRRVIRAHDEVSSQLEMLDVLPAKQMAELLAEELTARGFQREGDVLVRIEGDIEVKVELETGKVTVRAATAREVEVEGQREGFAYDDAGPRSKDVEKQLERQLRESLENDAQRQGRQLQSEVTDQFERRLGDIATELDQAVNRATAEALKRKAAQMGRIKQMADDPESGSLTIVVEL